MTNRILILLFCLGCFTTLVAQDNPIEFSADLNGITEVFIRSDYSSVHVSSSSANNSTGGKESDLFAKHVVTVDGKDQPELRELDVRREGNRLYVEAIKPTIDLLKERFPDGFKTENGDVYVSGWTSESRDEKVIRPTLETSLYIRVPDDVLVEVETKYGDITTEGVKGLKRAYAEYGTLNIQMHTAAFNDVELESRYGKVDVSLPNQADVELTLRTEYGAIYTDFDIAIDTEASQQEDYLEQIIGQIGKGGKQLRCSTPYGNVYLRKAK